MAQQVITKYVDDLDGSEAAGTVEFGLDGKTYEIDLSKENAVRLQEALAEFVNTSRRAGGRSVATPRRSAGTQRATVDREQSKAVREWAKANGHEIADRGRVPRSVVEAFEAAHKGGLSPQFATAG